MVLQDFINNYTVDSQSNNFIHAHFTKMTNSNDVLLNHREYIEINKLGFGDSAFHYMWFLLLQHLFERKTSPRLLEIGVYKGQVICLWSLLSKVFNKHSEITCITPLSGNPAPKNTFQFYWNYFIKRKFREDVDSGNFYGNENYFEIINSLFAAFNLEFDKVLINKGLSSDKEILLKFADQKFDLIYIDGDHSQQAVEADIRNYAPKVEANGFLVMDDASCNIPGAENGEYWKGHQSVSDACKIITQFGFANVLNVGHNRIYKRTP